MGDGGGIRIGNPERAEVVAQEHVEERPAAKVGGHLDEPHSARIGLCGDGHVVLQPGYELWG